MKNMRGFTLIELLVVISIIALLATIIMPSLGMAKRYARRVHCLSNLHGIGIGWKMYLDEYPNKLPIATSLPESKEQADSITGMASIVVVMEKYIDDEKIWHCLSDDMNYYDTKGTSYEYWLGLGLPFAMALGDFDSRISQVRQQIEMAPHVVPVIWDADSFHPTSEDPDGRQAAFFDGHAEKCNLDDIEKQSADYFN